MRSITRPALLIGLLMVLSTFSWCAHANIIFEFDNAEIEEFNFVGALAADFGFSFGPDTFDEGDAFDIYIGSTAGDNDISSLFGVIGGFDGIQGLGFGPTLNIIPTSNLFYVTVIKQAGSFNISSMRAYFSLQGQGYLFNGKPIRAAEHQVSEPTILPMLLMLVCVIFWRTKKATPAIASQSRRYK